MSQPAFAALNTVVSRFFAESQPEARRILHGRGQRYPGLEQLNLDWYPPVLLIAAHAELSNQQQLLEVIAAADTGQQIETIILQHRYQQGSPAEFVMGGPTEEIVVQEGQLSFEVHPGRRQNSGLFMDMRLLREWLQANSSSKNVLNLFAYTCSLSVAALAGNAGSVTNVDVSKTSIAWGLRNHELNGQDLRRVKSIPHNLFTSWGKIKQYGRYDLVIIDPPTRQRGSFEASKDYGSVIKRLSSLCKPGAEVIACLNSPFHEPDFLLELFARHCGDAVLLGRMSAPEEYADIDRDRGLKIFRFQLP